MLLRQPAVNRQRLRKRLPGLRVLAQVVEHVAQGTQTGRQILIRSSVAHHGNRPPGQFPFQNPLATQSHKTDHGQQQPAQGGTLLHSRQRIEHRQPVRLGLLEQPLGGLLHEHSKLTP